ncbi:glutathione S-transferase family protein [Sphingomonas ginkgonis]|uniref:Glutathione S-transferase family protein n=1 Tax=Sphingomonas ginkgonis TaxID=2315330 RepID=A0A3R9Y506_9SPHN|nr:glutathione S-transferase family protein [Sphingomonas ginkgonis]RST30291.1 glutathione S-transferase family protein [Sphingomonas ginkgonis]
MRLYVFPFAPNVMRVQVIAAEKGIALEQVNVPDLPPGRFAEINPLGQVPALELDDGEVITESLTIGQYLDAVSGAPFLHGDSALERARIGMWERRAEMALFLPSIEYGHHTHSMFASFVTQHAEWAATLTPRAEKMLAVMGDRLDRSPWLAGDAFSAADITAALGYFGLVAFGGIRPSDRPSLQAWSGTMLARPSLAPLREAAAYLQTQAKEASA